MGYIMGHKEHYKKDLYRVVRTFKNQHNIKGVSKLTSQQLYNLIVKHKMGLPKKKEKEKRVIKKSPRLIKDVKGIVKDFADLKSPTLKDYKKLVGQAGHFHSYYITERRKKRPNYEEYLKKNINL